MTTKQQRVPNDLLTIRQIVSEYRNPSYWSWRRLALSGDLATIRMPSSASKKGRLGRILVRRSDVERFLDQCREVGD